MLLARVEGNIVATRKHPSLDGWRLVICQPIGASGEPEGAPTIAIDCHGAGMHQEVIISSDGLAARRAVGDDKSPVRWLVVGIVDESEPGKRI
ncbi:MAG TPA: EutN/CcmL family microcompartment protein [Candidatus Saccharimonadales bacterium]|nr:EutN/CcmL family microcompartment protein [Candidatus Saccharimonadales bacterium]